MDFGSSVIGMVFLLFCVVIFVILSRKNRKRDKELLQSLKQLAKQNKLAIDQYDTWNNSGIGIDKTANIIFSIRNASNQSNSQQVILSEMKKCKVIRVNRTGGKEEGNFNIVEKLELAFANRDSTKPETSVVFYNATDDGPALTGELQLTEQWCKMANDMLASLSLKK